VSALRSWVLSVLNAHRLGTHVPQDPGPMAPHFHADEEHPGGGFIHTHAGEDAPHAHSHAETVADR
jgi:urease accessory protein